MDLNVSFHEDHKHRGSGKVDSGAPPLNVVEGLEEP